jgi:predicted permease
MAINSNFNLMRRFLVEVLNLCIIPYNRTTPVRYRTLFRHLISQKIDCQTDTKRHFLWYPKKVQTTHHMIRNYFLTALRNLRNNKTNSFLNIFGLAIGIACAGLIFLWVEDELNFDSNNKKKDSVYFVMINATMDKGIFTHGSTPGPLGPAIQKDFPGIAATCRMTDEGSNALFTIGNKPVYAAGRYAEPTVFDLFTIPFVEGNPATALSQLYSLVITESTAKKFFGEEKNLIGRSVRVDGKQDYVITGVVKDFPDNATVRFEWLSPWQIYENKSNPWIQKWTNFGISTYVELKPGIRPADIDKRLYNYLAVKQGDTATTVHPFLFGMNKWHLYNRFENGHQAEGGIRYVRLFSTIAWIILLIACINFMNLATARSEQRAREVGVRKVLGAGKKNLIFQFIGEALFMAALATLTAIILISLTLPAFNLLVQKNLSLGLAQPFHLLALLLITIVCGLVAGSYPSFYLSSFNPVFVLKGIRLKTGSAALIRKGLVITQFTVSIILIIATIIIYQQIQHVKSRDLGFNKDNLLQLDLTGNMRRNFAVIKQDLLNTGAVENAALADHATLYGGNNTSALDWQGKTPNSNIVISQRLISPEYMSTTGMHITEGRDFQTTDFVDLGDQFIPKDKGAIFNVLVTRSFEKLMGKGSALGKWARLETGLGAIINMRVVGVVQDYVYGDMYGSGDPVVFYYIPQATSLMFVRLKQTGNPGQALAKMEAVFKKDNPAYPFEYKFVDEQFNELFSSETLISRLSRVFAALAVIISCLGLFGLAAYTAERRIKEIGIRKVLGASATGLASLLSINFLVLVGISCIIAFPVAWWIMHDWLNGYAYRIGISGWIFALSGSAAIGIALLTVSFQTLRAALANPVKCLRAE